MSARDNRTTVELMPTLQKVPVRASKLILDPNNPRFLEQDDDRTDGDDFLDLTVQKDAYDKMMAKDGHQIRELEKSIVTNGWQPVDQIFVRRHQKTEYYTVQEGNRRVTAIINLLDRDDLDKELRGSIETLNVMEIVSDCDETTIQIQISYLLGVRHHGSLKPWSPFAQAHNMYDRYLSSAKQTDETFQWDSGIGEEIANALSIDVRRVEERLRVHRAMKQIDAMPAVQEVGGIMAKYYSLCEEVLVRKGSKSKLPEYIRQDPVTMLLDDKSLERMDNLCQFSNSNREGAPLNDPAEWRKFDKILQDDNPQRKTEMIADVEDNHRQPSSVWAERETELHKPRWETWLEGIVHILTRVQFGDDLRSEEARTAGRRLANLLAQLWDRSPEKGEGKK